MAIRNKCYNTCFYLHDQFSIRKLFLVRHGTLRILSWWAEPIHIWIWMPNMKIFTTMQCDQHINNITAKPNKALGFLRSNLKIPSSRIKEQAYQTLVCPLVEYASTVWNPYTKTEINKIEAVQRRAARYIHVNLPAGAFSPDFEGPFRPSRQLSKSSAHEKNQVQ